MNVVVIIEDNINIKEILFEDTYFDIHENKFVEIKRLDSEITIAIFNYDKIIGVMAK